MSAEVERCAVELAWRQWTALGVAGVAPLPDHAVDLEAIVAFMPYIAEADPRLSDEALDWSVRFGPRFLSRSRLRQLRALMPAVGDRRADDLAGLLLSSARPAAPRAISHKSRTPVIDLPVLIQLRSRQVFGIGARADLLTALVMARSTDPVRISAIGLVGYSKPAIATVLDELSGVGVLGKWMAGNVAHYVVKKREPLRALLAPVPPPPPTWARRLAVVAVILDTWRRFGGRATYAVELAKALEHARPLTVDLQTEQPPLHRRLRTLVSDIDAWATRLLAA